MVSICHGADASSIFAKSCRELDASESLPTQSMTSVETTTSLKTSVTTVASTMVTAGNETVDPAEEVHPSPVPSQTDEEEDYVSPPSEPQGPKGFFDIFGWKSNETLPTPPKPDLDRQCPSDIGPLTACYDRRPILGCYCFILVQVSVQEFRISFSMLSHCQSCRSEIGGTRPNSANQMPCSSSP